MHKFNLNELIGQRFGRWTVIGPSRRDDKGGQLIKCRCDCGNTVYRAYNQLVAFNKGCYQCTRRLNSKANRPYTAARRRGE